MKTEKNILIAFVINFAFSIFEFIGGIITGSVAVVSDAIHDIGDAASIGICYFLEKKSKKQPDEEYTYGYGRLSVIGGFITTMILFAGSVMVIYNAFGRIIKPVEINYNGMISFAVIGVLVNFFAAFFTREGDSLNQRAVNLHMLEDVFGWAVVLIGAVVMKFTDFLIIDPIMSIFVAVFILINSIKNLKDILDVFLEKIPDGIDVFDIKEHIKKIEGIEDVHHIHIWSIDGQNNFATMHIVTNQNQFEIKKRIKEELKEHGICHATLELETPEENCCSMNCHIEESSVSAHHHHHH